MGIAPYKTFTFDGKSSADYDVYLTGVGVFDSPERDVEMIEILGRNGNFALDRGRFRNVSVKYKIGMYDLNEANFATKVSAFRNWLCSKVGYVRLSDDYNPNEYRMAVYASGFELKHEFLIAGEAEITFDCKPQRWLTSGETANAVTSGGTLTNPTLFEASPLLEVYGYGNIDIGGQEIDINDVPIGYVVFSEDNIERFANSTRTFDTSMFANGDNITANIGFDITYSYSGSYDITSIHEDASTNCTMKIFQTVSRQRRVRATTGFVVTKGTASTDSFTAVYTVRVRRTSPSYDVSTQITIDCSVAYDGNGTFSITVTGSHAVSHTTSTIYYAYGLIDGTSTKSALGNPMYIDLDIGECWNEDYGEPISVNDSVSLGSELPKLPTGTTTITYDNTITSLKVAPRWWQV